MKRVLFCLLAMIVVLGLGTTANAYTLELRGTDTMGNRLIYDPDLDITWYDYSNARTTWVDQVAWASGLSVTFGGDTYNDWRLPATVDGTLVDISDPSFFNGTGPNGYNITTSEMGYLYYTQLGNLGKYDTSGNPASGFQGVDWGLVNIGIGLAGMGVYGVRRRRQRRYKES